MKRPTKSWAASPTTTRATTSGWTRSATRSTALGAQTLGHSHQRFYLRDYLVVPEGCFQKDVRAERKTLEARQVIFPLRDQEYWRRRQSRILGPNALDHPEAVDIRQYDVHEHQVRRASHRSIETRASTRGNVDLVARADQEPGNESGHPFVGFDDEDTSTRHAIQITMGAWGRCQIAAGKSRGRRQLLERPKR